MDARALALTALTYSGAAGLLTVGVVVLLTHSGLSVLVIAGVGILLVVLGGAAGGPGGVPTFEGSEWAGPQASTPTDGTVAPTPSSVGTRAVLLFYGLGLTLWSALTLAFLGSSLT